MSAQQLDGLAARRYVLLISGTMNPPHQGHVRLGLAAARALEAEGHTVASICFVPVHDNYLHNKVMLDDTKIDISLVAPSPHDVTGPWVKQGQMNIEAMVTDDRYAFHTPARWAINHPQAAEVLSFSATFTGQARLGDRIAVRGTLETDPRGHSHIVVGQSREAEDGYIRVIPTPNDSSHVSNATGDSHWETNRPMLS